MIFSKKILLLLPILGFSACSTVQFSNYDSKSQTNELAEVQFGSDFLNEPVEYLVGLDAAECPTNYQKLGSTFANVPSRDAYKANLNRFIGVVRTLVKPEISGNNIANPDLLPFTKFLPVGKEIAILATAYIKNGNRVEYCDVNSKVVLEKGSKYSVSYFWQHGACSMAIKNITDMKNITNVDSTKVAKKCSIQ